MQYFQGFCKRYFTYLQMESYLSCNVKLLPLFQIFITTISLNISATCLLHQWVIIKKLKRLLEAEISWRRNTEQNMPAQCWSYLSKKVTCLYSTRCNTCRSDWRNWIGIVETSYHIPINTKTNGIHRCYTIQRWSHSTV